MLTCTKHTLLNPIRYRKITPSEVQSILLNHMRKNILKNNIRA